MGLREGGAGRQHGRGHDKPVPKVGFHVHCILPEKARPAGRRKYGGATGKR
jgi:hypothetical protein